MRAGRLRHKVTLMTPANTVTDLGEIETGYTNEGTFYAEVISKVGGEFTADNATNSTTNYTIYMRYNSTDFNFVQADSFLVFGDRVLRILSSAMADHRNRMVVIQADEIATRTLHGDVLSVVAGGSGGLQLPDAIADDFIELE